MQNLIRSKTVLFLFQTKIRDFFIRGAIERIDFIVERKEEKGKLVSNKDNVTFSMKRTSTLKQKDSYNILILILIIL